MVDLSLHPDEYKMLWWAGLVDEAVARHGAFTMQELMEIAYERSRGTRYRESNFQRAALRYAPIVPTDKVRNKRLGRPAILYVRG